MFFKSFNDEDRNKENENKENKNLQNFQKPINENKKFLNKTNFDSF
jgi:hypothetical protein